MHQGDAVAVSGDNQAAIALAYMLDHQRAWAGPSRGLGGHTQHAQSIEPNQPKVLEGTLLLLGH